MIIHEFGNKSSEIVLVQPVDGHDLASMEMEVRLIREAVSEDFRLLAPEVDNWNADLSPWKAPAVFGKEDFGDGAAGTLAELLKLCEDRSKTYYLGGYSLAGLFSLWAVYQTDVFKGAAAASPSIWFPGFVGYMKENALRADSVYLSLGDKESRTRNPVMAAVGEKITEAYHLLQEQGKDVILEWNPGNHFRDADIRTAKAFAWTIKR